MIDTVKNGRPIAYRLLKALIVAVMAGGRAVTTSIEEPLRAML